MKLNIAIYLILLGLFTVFSCTDPKAKAKAEAEARQKAFFLAILEKDNAKIQELIDMVDINATNEEGNLAIHLAIEAEDKELIDLLLENKVDITARNSSGENAYEAALRKGNKAMALTLLKDGPLVNKKAWITTPQGLRFRDNPGLESQRLGVIPHHDEILVIKASPLEFTITGDKGKWAYIDWNGKKGWVFDAYLSFQQDLTRVIGKASKYKANHLSGVKESKGAVSISEEVHFSRALRCEFNSTQYFSDSTEEIKQKGVYKIQGNKIILVLNEGRKNIKYSEEKKLADETESIPASQLVLIWKDEISGFLHEKDVAKLESEEYVLDEMTHQFKQELGGEFQYIGYFHLF